MVGPGLQMVAWLLYSHIVGVGRGKGAGRERDEGKEGEGERKGTRGTEYSALFF